MLCNMGSSLLMYTYMYITKLLYVIRWHRHEVNCIDEVNGVSRIELEGRMYLDSCASSQVCIVTSPSLLTVVNPEVSSINLTDAGKTMSRTHIGSRAGIEDIAVCPSSRKNICSLSKLESIGYGFTFLRSAKVIDLETNVVVAEASLDNGMPWLPLEVFFGLPTKTSEEVNNLTDSKKNEMDPLVCLHKRTACTSMAKIIETYRNNLANDVDLRRYHLTKKARKKKYATNCFCDVCAKTKITRKVFKSKERITATKFLDRINCDISVYLNCESREGYKYVLLLIDSATKDQLTTSVVAAMKEFYADHVPSGESIKLFFC